MKRVGKPVSFIIALLILVFSVISVIGISYYTGDNRNTVFKGFGDIDWGTDVSGGTRLVLSPATTDEVSFDQLQSTAKVIEDRIVNFGLTDYEIYCSKSDSTVVLTLPESLDSAYSAEQFGEIVTSRGYVTLRAGNSYEQMIVDSSNSGMFVIPKDTTASTVLLTSDNLKTSAWFDYDNEGVKYYYVNLIFDEIGKGALAQYSATSTGTYYNQTISIWLDDIMLASPKMDNAIEDGVLTFSGQGYTADKANLYSSVAKSGTLPVELKLDKTSAVAGIASDKAATLIMIAALVAFLIIAVIMIYRYRMIGVVSLFSALLEFSAIIAVVTRLWVQGNTFLLTLSGAGALALCVLLNVFFCVLFGEKIKKSLYGSPVISEAVSGSILSVRRIIVDINAVMCIVALVGLLMFGSAGLISAIFGGSAVSGVSNFCYILLFGSIINFVSGYLLPELMIRSLSSYNKSSFFGGKKL